MNLLEKFLHFFRNLIAPKPTRLNKNLIAPKPTRLNKNLSSDKISRNSSSDAKLISKLKPGHYIDACTLMNCEEFPKIVSVLKSLTPKIFYVTSKTKDEFDDQKIWSCKTGRYEKRDFDNAIKTLEKLLRVKIINVKITPEIQTIIKAKKLLLKYQGNGLHYPDNIHFAFALFTNSTLITSDTTLIRICKIAKCDCIEFNEFVRESHMVWAGDIPSKFHKRRKWGR